MTSIPCNIVLLPDDILTSQALAASQSLALMNPLFTLEIGKFYPHLSLYMFQLDIDDIAKVEEVIQRIVAMSRAVSTRATQYALDDGSAIGYVDAEYEISDDLRGLQDKVLAAVNPLRSGMRAKDIARMKEATGVKLTNLQTYGYASVGELFRPHLTLTRLKEARPEVLDMLPDIDNFSGQFDRLGLFEMGDNGTCVRKIAEFELANRQC